MTFKDVDVKSLFSLHLDCLSGDDTGLSRAGQVHPEPEREPQLGRGGQELVQQHKAVRQGVLQRSRKHPNRMGFEGDSRKSKVKSFAI